jgi:6-phosphogluconolactonase
MVRRQQHLRRLAERVVRRPSGGWEVEYIYDDSTVIAYDVEADGRLGPIRDVAVLTGHGVDPNHSSQAGGHAQASAHAHCAVVDPSGRFVVVCDKGTDQILVYRLGETFELAFSLTMAPETGPRHLAFAPTRGLAFMTCEFSSELASLKFDFEAGNIELIDKVSTVAAGFAGPNEPAEVRVHPGGRFVYVNNRGEDSLAWFQSTPAGGIARSGHVGLATSVHPGLAARSFAFSPSGAYVLVADRPANLVRSFLVDERSGDLRQLGEIEVSQPAFIEFAELGGA